jgi:hypothetical protein
MPRRVSLPNADDLFRGNGHARGGTTRELDPPLERTNASAKVVEQPRPDVGLETAAEMAARKSSGRVRHDEKMTVYVTADELLDLEHARLSLRRHQGLAVDRGRLVREAIAMAIEDLELNGDDSVLVQRLIAR